MNKCWSSSYLSINLLAIQHLNQPHIPVWTPLRQEFSSLPVVRGSVSTRVLVTGHQNSGALSVWQQFFCFNLKNGLQKYQFVFFSQVYLCVPDISCFYWNTASINESTRSRKPPQKIAFFQIAFYKLPFTNCRQTTVLWRDVTQIEPFANSIPNSTFP